MLICLTLVIMMKITHASLMLIKKIYVKMKDELFGTKAKMYSFKTQNEEKKCAKGIQNVVIKKTYDPW